MEDRQEATVAAMALQVLERSRELNGSLGAAQCDVLAAMLETAQTESRILAKSNKVLATMCADAKEALLRCRSPEGDEAARLLRLRVIGSLEDVARGVADTDGLQLRWRAIALTEIVKLRSPRRRFEDGSRTKGILKFEKKEGGED